ncbi:TPA: helix-turn-helix transcriptional regulator [Vibrio campbellii]|uniref:helix-turn-helix transcriptional regulator n=1 Tax=Vibrio sp. M260121 TaxID=3020897 RepID=UPI002F3E2285|nr:helix-turn-helix transcriptional regulator [Vibrio campbellii]HDM8242984.1 helix-turn-helix transcriptional regulator [Vibrio campbellii]
MFFHNINASNFRLHNYRTKKTIFARVSGYQGDININSSPVQEFNNSLIIIPKNSFVHVNISKLTEQSELDFISLNDFDIGFIKQDLYELNKFIFDKRNRKLCRSSDGGNFLKAHNKDFCDVFLMNRVVDGHRCMGRLNKTLLRQSVVELLIHLHLENKDINIVLNMKSDLSVSERLSNLLMREPRKHWTLEAAALSMATSISTLRRGLSAEQKSFSCILNEVRLNVAIRYLKFSNFSILKISNLSGFKSSAYFCTVFKKNKLTTPQQFRSRFRKSIV